MLEETQRRIHAISDLHGQIPYLPGGDLLIVAGDLTMSGEKWETKMFASWLDNLSNYQEKVVIGGNHDRYLTHKNNPFKKAHYLLNSSITLFGYKIWGSPYTPSFGNWFFMKNRGQQMKEIWDQIPEDTDILVTHGPPYGILDQNRNDIPCGCEELRRAVDRIRPKYHVFGHIHEEYGQTEKNGTTFINCSYMDQDYEPRGTYAEVEGRYYYGVPNCS
jgi:Icc-related predicted phosphoesterase